MAKARDKGSKAKAKTAGRAAGDGLPRLSAHPRAARHIREAKAWSGLAGFALVLLLSLHGGAPILDAGGRALVAGCAMYVLGWGLAVLVWRHVARAEVLVAEQRYRERIEAP